MFDSFILALCMFYEYMFLLESSGFLSCIFDVRHRKLKRFRKIKSKKESIDLGSQKWELKIQVVS
jgi:hypothetical protein